MIERAHVIEVIAREIALAGSGAGAVIGESTALLGEGAVVDSHGILQILLALEDIAGECQQAGFDWASDATFSSRRSPLRTVGTLADFFLGKVGAT